MVNRSLNVRQGRTDSKHPVLSLVCSINTLLYKKLSSFFLHLYLIPSLRVPWTTAGLLNKTFGGCSCGASSKPFILFLVSSSKIMHRRLVPSQGSLWEWEWGKKKATELASLTKNPSCFVLWCLLAKSFSKIHPILSPRIHFNHKSKAKLTKRIATQLANRNLTLFWKNAAVHTLKTSTQHFCSFPLSHFSHTPTQFVIPAIPCNLTTPKIIWFNKQCLPSQFPQTVFSHGSFYL